MKKHDTKEWGKQHYWSSVCPTTKPSLQKRLSRWLVGYQWPIIILLWLLAIILGYIGHFKYFIGIGEVPIVTETLYRAVQLFSMESTVSGSVGWELHIARFMAPAIAIYTGIFALAIIFHEQVQLFCLRFIKDHVVICGLGRKGLLLSREFRKNGERVVVIEQDRNNSMIGLCKEYGSIILAGISNLFSVYPSVR